MLLDMSEQQLRARTGWEESYWSSMRYSWILLANKMWIILGLNGMATITPNQFQPTRIWLQSCEIVLSTLWGRNLASHPMDVPIFLPVHHLCLLFSLYSWALLFFLLVLFNIIFLSFYIRIRPFQTIYLETHQQIFSSVMFWIKKYCIYEKREKNHRLYTWRMEILRERSSRSEVVKYC